MKGEQGAIAMKTRRALFYCLAVLMGGCIPVFSLQPLFTSDELVFDERLLGTWVEDVNEPKDVWQFTRFDADSGDLFGQKLEDPNAYRLQITSNGHRGDLVAVLGNLGDELFLNVFAVKLPGGQTDIEDVNLPYNAMLFVRTHTFFKVEPLDDELKLHFTDDVRFAELLKADPNAVRYEVIDGTPILTATTQELQAFATKYADDERLFATEVLLVRKPK
jgi:hypothetical protein